MTSIQVSRRALAGGLTAATAGLGLANMAFAAAGDPESAESDGVSHTAAAIHQEVVLNADRRRVYAALTQAPRFDAVTRLSDAIALVTAPGAAPTRISGEVGGAFTLFGGYITGRQIELTPDARLVQVWRAGRWAPGDYSLVKFTLADEGAATRLVFDHTGFPPAEAASLARGWRSHYWAPLARYLARQGG
jgi:activator of HSP90 ATPase